MIANIFQRGRGFCATNQTLLRTGFIFLSLQGYVLQQQFLGGHRPPTESCSDPSQLQFDFPTSSANKAVDLLYFILLLPPLHLLCSGTSAATSLTTAVAERAVTAKQKASTGTQLLNIQWRAHLWDNLEHRSANPQRRRARQEPCLLHHWEEQPTEATAQDVPGSCSKLS